MLNASGDIFSGAAARWAAADQLKERGEIVLSPADRVRLDRTSLTLEFLLFLHLMIPLRAAQTVNEMFLQVVLKILTPWDAPRANTAERMGTWDT